MRRVRATLQSSIVCPSSALRGRIATRLGRYRWGCRFGAARSQGALLSNVAYYFVRPGLVHNVFVLVLMCAFARLASAWLRIECADAPMSCASGRYVVVSMSRRVVVAMLWPRVVLLSVFMGFRRRVTFLGGGGGSICALHMKGDLCAIGCNLSGYVGGVARLAGCASSGRGSFLGCCSCSAPVAGVAVPAFGRAPCR